MFNRIWSIALALTIVANFVLYATRAEAQEFVTDGLISFWTFDQSDIEGNTVKDVWGNHDGKIQGNPKVVDGQIEEALEFDGSDDWVKVPYDRLNCPYPLEDSPRTVEGWVTIERWEYSAFTWWGNHDLSGCFFFVAYKPEKFVLYTIDWDLSEASQTDVIGKTGEWFHFAAEYRPDEDKLLYFINGEKAGESVLANKLRTEVNPDYSWLAIGGTCGGEARCFHKGKIDEVRIYNRALSKDEIKQNMKIRDNSADVRPIGKLSLTWGEIKFPK